jgi:hypothetical protein
MTLRNEVCVSNVPRYSAITHLDGLYSQGPGTYLGCPEGNKGDCPKQRPVLPSALAPSFRPQAAWGPRWRPGAFHHVQKAKKGTRIAPLSGSKCKPAFF